MWSIFAKISCWWQSIAAERVGAGWHRVTTKGPKTRVFPHSWIAETARLTELTGQFRQGVIRKWRQPASGTGLIVPNDVSYTLFTQCCTEQSNGSLSTFESNGRRLYPFQKGGRNMSCHKRFWMTCSIVLFSACAMGSEWGTWNDLPGNILEPEQGVHSLDELSRQLDLLIQHKRGVDNDLRGQLLSHWMEQISADTPDTVSLDRLLEISEDWKEGDASEWRDDLDAFLEEQVELFEDRQDDLEDDLEDQLDDDSDLYDDSDDLDDDETTD